MTTPPPNSIQPKSRAEWRKWLSSHHTQEEGVWLITFKKSSGKQLLDYAGAVEEALCFGWVDSKGNKLDEERTMLWFTARKKGSGWSKLNKSRIEKLISAELMMPAGLAKIAAAKKDGSWSSLDSIEELEIPPDLEKAFAANKTAYKYFNEFPRSAKRAILFWIAGAKKPETRAKRIQETVTSASKNIRAKQ
ncbi:MAG: YdeI/OmpD-associated family protein [Ignavibacteriales bacterium]|nr:YdeI/OmpD-associated family protein [Ignavibacteriales bacterium]